MRRAKRLQRGCPLRGAAAVAARLRLFLGTSGVYYIHIDCAGHKVTKQIYGERHMEGTAYAA